MNKIAVIGEFLREVRTSRRQKTATADGSPVQSGNIAANYRLLMGLSEAQVALVQVAVAVTTILTGLVAVLSGLSSEYTSANSTIVLVIGLSAIPASLVFFIGPWPSQRLLYGFVIYCDLTIAAGLLLKDDRLFAIGGTALFAGVTMLCVAATPVRICALHIGFAVATLGAIAVRAAVAGADLWTVAAHSLTMLLLFSAPLLLLVQVVQLRTQAHWARLDPLTGLANRRGLLSALNSIPPPSEHTRVIVSIAIIDIDHFKMINDHHGHPAGDEALIAISGHLRSIASDSRAIARVGGDEFACLWSGPESDVTRSVTRAADTLRAAPILPGITVSVGIGSLPLEKNANRTALLQHILDRADAEMYRFKNSRER